MHCKNKHCAGCYKFTRYKTGKLDAAAATNSTSANGNTSAADKAAAADGKPVLVIPEGADVEGVLSMATAFYWVRRLVVWVRVGGSGVTAGLTQFYHRHTNVSAHTAYRYRYTKLLL